jgi:formylglycine-generating enzyme required for sulfatase activity
MSDLQHELDVINKKVKKCKKKLKRSELAQQLKQLKQERSLLKIRVNELEDVERKKQHELDKQTLIDLGFELRGDYEVILVDGHCPQLYQYAIVHKNVPQFESITVNRQTKIKVLVLGLNSKGIWYDAISKWNRLSSEEQQKFMNLEEIKDLALEDLGNDIQLDMMLIPGGTFIMGSLPEELEHQEDESPQHFVTVQPFFMGKYQVTQEQWRFVAQLPQVNRELEQDPSYFKGDNRPVEQVSWEDAVEFCDRLSQYTGRTYRLPSEAEWEYACRAGTKTPFHFGDNITTDLVNYDGTYPYKSAPKGKYREQTTDVGTFPPNAFGLYDMHGNLDEWCLDDWHDNYKDAPTDGSAWFSSDDKLSDKSGRAVLRGGSWLYDAGFCRSAFRDRNLRGIRGNFYGFRVVCSAMCSKLK